MRDAVGDKLPTLVPAFVALVYVVVFLFCMFAAWRCARYAFAGLRARVGVRHRD